MPDRLVLISSGCICCGKSYLLKRLLTWPELVGAKSFHLDPLRLSLFGDRADGHITRTEHIFKNECMRHEMLKALVLGAPIVASEIVMLTRKAHQKPIVEMVTRAEEYIQAIEEDACKRDGQPPPETASEVRLKVVLCYASLQAIERRLAGDLSERRASGTEVCDWGGMYNGYRQFELPDESTYEPLYLDTSDESPEANEARFREIRLFLASKLDLREVNAGRKASAAVYQGEILERIEKEMAKS